MPRSTRKAVSPAEAAPRTRKVTAAVSEAAPVSPARGFDYAALAAGAKDAVLPETTRNGFARESKTAVLAELVTTSFTDNVAKALPPVPGDESTARTLVSAVRRAASMAGLGVSVRAEMANGHVTVTFLGKPKRNP